MSAFAVEVYPAREFPEGLKIIYRHRIQDRVESMNEKNCASVRTKQKIENWVNYLTYENACVFVLRDGGEPTVFATVLDFSQQEESFVRIAELNSKNSQKGDGELMLRFIQRQYPKSVLYGVVHKTNELREYYRSLGAEEGKYWFPLSHPNHKREDGWIGVAFGNLQERKVVQQYLCVIIYGSEYPGVTVGIAEDVRAIAGFFIQFQEVKVVQISHANMDAADFKSFLEKMKDSYKKVFIYYTGHGFNPGDSEFPAFMCKGSRQIRLEEDIYLPCKELFDFAVVGADCCNETVKPPLLVSRGHRSQMIHPFNGNGYLIFSSSVKGQSSYGTTDGGLFRSIFLTEFHGDWIGALHQTKKRMENFLQIVQREQKPQWKEDDFQQFIQKSAKIEEEEAEGFPFVEEIQ